MNRSEDGYILREDFLRYFALPGLIGGVLCFRESHFQKDCSICLIQAIAGNSTGQNSRRESRSACLAARPILTSFCSGSSVWTGTAFGGRVNLSGGTIEFDVFQSIVQHLPPSVFFVVLKSTEERSSYAQSGHGGSG